MNLTDLLAELGVEYREHGTDMKVSRGWVGLKCPHCRSRSFRCGVNLKSLAASCWVCGKVRLGETLALASGRQLRDVLLLLSRLDRWQDFGPIPAGRVAGRYEPPIGVGELLPPHRRYLHKRRLDPDQVLSVWGVRGIGPVGEHRWRLFLPVRFRHREVSWTTRAVGSCPIRYKSAEPDRESVPLKHTLFGFDFVRTAVCVCEGPLDAVRIGSGAVATYGAAVTEHQVCLIARFPRRIVCMDSDAAGRTAAQKLVDLLSVWPGETLNVELSSGKDPGDASGAEVGELRKMLE